ncbi:DUF2628 domain-containing protein [Methyloraptor flagellatus]|uniref:DUF2628 domain-containing protein n=1 Tax=Methyloraptor flagellatus TaxID=3162530 RepID=A0AAU7X7G3_9HYPH
MATWTVHAPPGADAGLPAHDALRFTREGFAWAALVFGPLWALWNRLWLVFLGWLVAILVIEILARVVGEPAATVASFVFAVWFALSAADLKRWTLERRGWRLVDLVEASGRDEAEKRHFDKVALSTRAGRVETPRAVAASAETETGATRRIVPPGGALPPVVGFDAGRGGRP